MAERERNQQDGGPLKTNELEVALPVPQLDQSNSGAEQPDKFIDPLDMRQ